MEPDHFNLYHSPENLAHLAKLRDMVKDDALIVEIGAHVGIATLVFAAKKQTVYAVDPWHWDSLVYDEQDALMEDNKRKGGGKVIFQKFCQNCGDKLFKTIFPIRAYSQEACDIFPFSPDMVYIDGDHRFESTLRDVTCWGAKLKSGGVLAGDDYERTSVKAAVHYAGIKPTIIGEQLWCVRKV